MKKLNRFLQKYLIYSMPFVVIVSIWGTLTPEKIIYENPSIIVHAIWEVLSWNIMLWFFTLIIFLFTILFHLPTREQAMRSLARVQERDEREELIVARASRLSFPKVLSLLIFLLFLSVFKLNITKLPKEEAINGKTGTVSIGLGMKLWDEPNTQKNEKGEIIFQSNDIPLSKSAIILIILAVQLVTFRNSSRKLQVE